FIRFDIGGEHYAVPLDNVTKIGRVPTIVPVPRTPEFVKGIASLRGEIVTVVDLCAVLGVATPEQTPHGLLVLQDGTRRVGILSDGLPDYFRAQISTLTPAPSGRSSDALVAHAIEREQGIVAVLDVRKLMDVL